MRIAVGGGCYKRSWGKSHLWLFTAVWLNWLAFLFTTRLSITKAVAEKNFSQVSNSPFDFIFILFVYIHDGRHCRPLWEVWQGSWELISCLLKERQAVLTTKSSLQSPFYFCSVYSFCHNAFRPLFYLVYVHSPQFCTLLLQDTCLPWI